MPYAICTPVFGDPTSASVPLQYHERCRHFMRSPDFDVFDMRLYVNTDLVRARSRAVTASLAKGVDGLIFWDVDVVAPVEQVAAAMRGMVHSGHDLVCVPYARKRGHWANVGPKQDEEIEAGYVLHAADAGKIENGCAPCRYVPMGFTYISRRLMKAVTEWEMCRHLQFRDHFEGAWHPSVAVFALIINSEGLLLSEDYSFCERAAALGFRPHVYLGQGTKLQHVGTAVYGVSPEA